MGRAIRVLQLLGEAPDFQTERSIASLRGNAGPDFEQTLARIGIPRQGPPAPGELAYRNLPLAVVGVRRLARDFDLVHAWGAPALRAAVLAGARSVLFSPTRQMGRLAVSELRAMMGLSGQRVRVICPTETQRRAIVRLGTPIESSGLVRPGVDFSLARGTRNPALRAKLGFADDDFVVLAPGESNRTSAHVQAVWSASILAVLSPTWKALVWGRGPIAGKIAGLARRLGQPGLVRVGVDRLGPGARFEALLGAADAALVADAGPSDVLPIAYCMAAGVPIVSAVTSTSAELLEDRHTALMCPPGKPRLLARRLLELRESPEVRQSLRQRARAEAYDVFAQTRFVEEFRDAYRRCAAGDRARAT